MCDKTNVMADAVANENDLMYIREIAAAPDPVVTSTELGDRLDVTQQSAHSKLQSLEEKGFVRKRKVGSKAVVWWLTTDGRDVYKNSES